MDIIATRTKKNGEVQKQRFTELGWKLLGPDKNGWVASSDNQTIGNKVSAPMPSTGSKPEQKISNKLEKKPPATVIGNSVQTEGEKKSEVSEADKEAFMKQIEGFNKSTIKDFFDDKEIPYDNKADLKVLKNQLAEYFKFDVVELQKEFK